MNKLVPESKGTSVEEAKPTDLVSTWTDLTTVLLIIMTTMFEKLWSYVASKLSVPHASNFF